MAMRPFGPVQSLIAANIDSTEGDAKILPKTAAVKRPCPINPGSEEFVNR